MVRTCPSLEPASSDQVGKYRNKLAKSQKMLSNAVSTTSKKEESCRHGIKNHAKLIKTRQYFQKHIIFITSKL